MLQILRSKRLGALTGAFLLLIGTASIVFAEGSSGQNPLTNVSRGWETGNYWDTAGDSASSRMVFNAHCDDNHSGTADASEWGRLQLLRFAGIFPWEVRGDVIHTCGNVNANWNYGIQASPPDWFKWKIVDFSGSGKTFEVPSPGVNWYW
jgi:hypothetical protein